MKDLAFKENKNDMYPTMAKEGKQEPRYPSVSLPLSLLNGKNIEVGDKVEMTVSGTVERVEKSKYYEEFGVKLKSGEIKEEKKNNTLV